VPTPSYTDTFAELPEKYSVFTLFFLFVTQKTAEYVYNYLFLPVIFILLCHKLNRFNHWEISMDYKQMKKNWRFVDFILADSVKHKLSLKNMKILNEAIDRSWIDAILMNHYNINTSSGGADAYPPLLLFKYVLL
jgi:hypothetical protein